jgi:hypothetical protein
MNIKSNVSTIIGSNIGLAKLPEKTMILLSLEGNSFRDAKIVEESQG